MSRRVEWPAVRAGALAGVAIALPVAVLAQILSGHVPFVLMLALFLIVIVSHVFAGWTASRSATETPYTTAGFAALLTYVAVQAVGVVTNSIRGNDVNIVAVVFNALVAFGLGVLGTSVVKAKRTT